MVEAYSAKEFLHDAQHEPWLGSHSLARRVSKAHHYGAVRQGILSWELSTIGLDEEIEGISLSVNHQESALCLQGLTTVVAAFMGDSPFYRSYVTDSRQTIELERPVCANRQQALRGYMRGHEEDRVMFLGMLVSLNPAEKEEIERLMPSERRANLIHPHRKLDLTPCPHNMTQNGFDPTNVPINWATDPVEGWAADRVERWVLSDITRLGH